jgi:hypothetical protein
MSFSIYATTSDGVIIILFGDFAGIWSQDALH